MSTVAIKVAGVDYAAAVLYSTAYFSSSVNGIAGSANLRIRDPDRTLSIVAGASLELLIDGNPVWTGFCISIKRSYVFPALNITDFGNTRFIDIVGTDLNVLFTRRFAFKQSDPFDVYGPLYGANTADTTAIAALVAGWLDLTGDSIDTSSDVHNVANINEDQDARAWLGSDSWGAAMTSIASLPGAVFYIRPDRKLAYVDDDTPDAPFGLSDAPNGTTKRGYREMEILLDGTGLANDVFGWGAGYGSSSPVFDRDTDAASISTHGLWQMGQVVFGTYKQLTIEKVVDSIINGSPLHLRGAKDDRTAVTLTTYEAGLLPAQKVSFESTVFGWSDVLPIRKMEVTFEAKDNPKYVLTLSHEIDTPNLLTDVFALGGFPKFPPFQPFPPIRGSGDPGGCTSAICGITDSFTRTESFPQSPPVYPATAIGQWGTSDAGFAWTPYISSGVQFSCWVDGSQGVIRINQDGSSQIDLSYVPTTPLDLRAFGIGQTCSVGSVGGTIDFSFTTFGNGLTVGVAQDGKVTVSVGSGSATVDLASNLIATGDKVNFRVTSSDGTTDAQLYAWLNSNPEPTTPGATITAAGGTHDLSTLRVQAFPTGFTTQTIDFTLDGLDISGVNRCTGYIFDDFNRTVVPTSSSEWGTASSGLGVWYKQGPGTSTQYVYGDVGVFTQTDEGVVPNEHGDAFSYLTTPAAAWSGDFEFTGSFTPSSWPDPSFPGTLMVWGIGIDEASPPSGFAQGVVITKRNHLVSDQDTVSLITPSLTTDVNLGTLSNIAYRIRWKKTGTQHQVKFWPAYATEPSSWLIDRTGTAITPACFFVYQGQPNTRVFAGGANSTATGRWDDFNFDYAGKPCYDCAGTICGITDSFNRTVVNGLGTSDYGAAWRLFGTTSNFNVGSGEATVGPDSEADLVLDAQTTTLSFQHAVTGVSSGTSNGTYVGGFGNVSGTRYAVSVSAYPNGTLEVYPDFHTTTLSFATTSLFNLSIELTGSGAANVFAWAIGSAKPGSPTLTATTVLTSFQDQFQCGTFGPVTAHLALLDAVGVGKCAYPQFDPANRSVVSGWDNGWTLSGNAGATVAASDVETSAAYPSAGLGIEITAHSGLATLTKPPPWGATVDSSFTCQFVFEVDNVFGAPLKHTAIVGFGGGLIGVTLDIQSGASTASLSTPFGTVGPTAISITAGRNYLGEVVYTGAAAEFRLWGSGEARPTSALLSETTDSTPIVGDVLCQVSQTGGATDVTFPFWFHYISFNYAEQPCYPGGASPAPAPASPAGPLYGPICENAVRVDSTHYTTTRLFAAGTTVVNVNGYLYRLGSSGDYTASGNVLTMLDPITAPTAVVYVCYTAAGAVS